AVTFEPPSPSVYGISTCQVQIQTPVSIQCQVNPGCGGNNSVVVTALGVSNSNPSVIFSYDSLFILSVFPTLIPTTGASITIVGSNFGSPTFQGWAVPQINFNGQVVTPPAGNVNQTDIIWTAPAGVGVNYLPTFSVCGQVAQPDPTIGVNDGFIISYLGPS